MPDLCDKLVARLEENFGKASAMGSVYRWSIKTNDPFNPVVLAVDDCGEMHAKAWLFDSLRMENKGVIQFSVHSLEEVEAVAQRIVTSSQTLIENRQAAAGSQPSLVGRKSDLVTG